MSGARGPGSFSPLSLHWLSRSSTTNTEQDDVSISAQIIKQLITTSSLDTDIWCQIITIIISDVKQTRKSGGLYYEAIGYKYFQTFGILQLIKTEK